jgi:3-hydroxybutyryl-CoA dehydrogenase
MKLAILSDSKFRSEWLERPASRNAGIIWVDSLEKLLKIGDADVYVDLLFELRRDRIQKLAWLLPKVVMVNAVTATLREIGQPFIRISGWPTLLGRPTGEAVLPPGIGREEGEQIFEAIGWPCEFLPDSPGMVSARILAMIVNEAYYTEEAGTSTKTEIDIAMKLGTNYPQGPFEWAAKIGSERIVELLIRLQHDDPRYTVSSLLLQKSTDPAI